MFVDYCGNMFFCGIHTKLCVFSNPFCLVGMFTSLTPKTTTPRFFSRRAYARKIHHHRHDMAGLENLRRVQQPEYQPRSNGECKISGVYLVLRCRLARLLLSRLMLHATGTEILLTGCTFGRVIQFKYISRRQGDLDAYIPARSRGPGLGNCRATKRGA